MSETPDDLAQLATNTQTLFTRLRALLPRGWFGQERGPVARVDALLQGPSSVLGRVLTQIQYIKLQTRLLTATGAWLDLYAFDYFGTQLRRRSGELDSSYRLRIYTNLLRERGTRHAVYQMLVDITGQIPIMREPRYTLDGSAYGAQGGYSARRGYGSINFPYVGAAVAYRPVPGSTFYGISDADIYEAINGVKQFGTEVYLQLQDGPSPVVAASVTTPTSPGMLDFSDPNESALAGG